MPIAAPDDKHRAEKSARRGVMASSRWCHDRSLGQKCSSLRLDHWLGRTCAYPVMARARDVPQIGRIHLRRLCRQSHLTLGRPGRTIHFCEEVLQVGIIEHRLRQQPLQLGVLVLERA